MKKIVAIFLSLFLFVPILHTYAIESGDTSKVDATYWEQKKIEMQNKSSEMRKEYYKKLVSQGADLSEFDMDLLDASKTQESEFWNAVRKIQNAQEIKTRKAYLEKMQAMNIDISGFTDAIIADGEKFWTLANKLKSQSENIDKLKYLQKIEMNKNSQFQNQEGNNLKKNTQQNALSEQAKKAFIKKLDSIPQEKREEMYKKLEKNITKFLEAAEKKGNKKLQEKYSQLLTILRERMNQEEVDDNTLIDNLFQ